MNWMNILKGAMWDEFTYKVKNDMFPTDLKEYVLYSKLMRDNKKTVDWYLEKGKSAASQEKKKLFRLILGEMRRENNFNYWMTDQEDKMLKQSKTWPYPFTESQWWGIFDTDENTQKFIKEYEQNKNLKPRAGTLSEAAIFLNRSKNNLFGLMRKVGGYDGRTYREKVKEWEPRYELLKPIMDAIIERDEKGDIIRQKNFDRFENRILNILNKDTLDMDDWEDLESILSSRYTDKRNRINKNNLRKLADKLGDEYILKHKNNLPQQTDEKSFEYTYMLMDVKGFRSEEEEGTYASFFDDEYDVVTPVTLEQAKKYLDKYSSIRKKSVGDETYSYDIMRLRGEDNQILLYRLGKVTGGKKLWLSKIFREILDINANLNEHDQWKFLKDKVNREFKFNAEKLKDVYLNESYRLSESGKSNPNIEIIPIGEDMSREKYKDALKRRIGSDEDSGNKWRNYLESRTSDIQAIMDSTPKVFVDFIIKMHEELKGGSQSEDFKEGLIEVLGPEDAEEYINLVLEKDFRPTVGFRQKGSGARGASGETIAIFERLEPEQFSGNKYYPIIKFIDTAYSVFYEGNDEDGWSDLEFEWEQFKDNYKEKDLSVELEQLGSVQSPFEELTEKFSKDTTKLIAEYIYLLYSKKTYLERLVGSGTKMKKDMSFSDYTMAEFIRVFFAAEESFSETNDILMAIQKIDTIIQKASNEESERMGYLFNSLDEGKNPLGNEITGLEDALVKSIPKIKKGLSDKVEINLKRIVKNKRKLKNEIPWMLEELLREDFIKVKGEEV